MAVVVLVVHVVVVVVVVIFILVVVVMVSEIEKHLSLKKLFPIRTVTKLIMMLLFTKITFVAGTNKEKCQENEEDANHEEDGSEGQDKPDLLFHRVLHLLLPLCVPFLLP